MEKFPDKSSAAVFLTAFVPDTAHQPSFVLDKFTASVLAGGWLDKQFWSYGSPEDPSTAMLLGSQFLLLLYSHSPSEDFELAMALQRPSSLFLSNLSKAKKFTSESYGSVRQAYIICKEDKGITKEFAHWMIENSGVQEVKEILGADHMAMLSQPQLLCDCLIELAAA